MSLLSGFRKPAAPQVPVRPPSGEPVTSLPPLKLVQPNVASLSRADLVKPTSSSQGEEGLPNKRQHLANYADLPKYVAVKFGIDDDQVAKLTETTPIKYLALDLGGKRMLVLMEVHWLPSQSYAAFHGALITSDHQVDVATTTSDVLRQVLKAGLKQQQPSIRGSGGAPATQFQDTVRQWIEYAIANRATDIHIQVLGTKAFVQFRIDGELEYMLLDNKTIGGSHPASYVLSCLGSIYNNGVQAKSNSDSLFTADRDLYGMIPYSDIPGHQLKLRFQSLRGNEGPKAVMRLLHVNDGAPTLTFPKLGYSEDQCRLWTEAMQLGTGMLLISGITGSGKSTTLKSVIELTPGAERLNTITIEDPVEYPIKHAHQHPVQRDIEDADSSSVAMNTPIVAAMRMDVDRVVVGEIRDKPTATAAVQIAETGHVAMGTVHAASIAALARRLSNEKIGLNREMLCGPGMLILLVYQALVPRLCSECAWKGREGASQDERSAQLYSHIREMGLPADALRWKRVGGCSACNHRGTIGQTVVAEMLMPEEDWLEPTRRGDDAKALAAYRAKSDQLWLSENMTGKTVFEHTLFLALQGITDPMQCLRFDSFHSYRNTIKRLGMSYK